MYLRWCIFIKLTCSTVEISKSKKINRNKISNRRRLIIRYIQQVFLKVAKYEDSYDVRSTEIRVITNDKKEIPKPRRTKK